MCVVVFDLAQLPLLTRGSSSAREVSAHQFRHRIKYVNQWREPRTFVFESTAPSLVRIENDRVQLQPRASTNIVLLITKHPQGLRELDSSFMHKFSDIPVYILIGDDRGRSEETMLVHLKYSR